MLLHRTLQCICLNDLRSSKPLWSIYVTGHHGRYLTVNNFKGNKKQEQIKTRFVDDDVRLPVRERLKKMAIVYGPLATVLHIGLSLTFLGLTYGVIKLGFDATGLLEKFNYFNETYARFLSAGGTFGVAYALYKAMMPFRVMVTIFLTPKVATKLQAMGIIKKSF